MSMRGLLPKPGPLVLGLQRMLRLRWRLLLRSFTRSEARNSDLVLLALAAAVGVAAGLGVIALGWGVRLFHAVAFGVPVEGHLSDGQRLVWWQVLLLPSLGGLAVGGVSLLVRRWGSRDIVDAIEANALYGGRMSLRDSLNLAALTVLSGGFGASVGLEAAYTQLGSSLASKLGIGMNLRREDVRTLVGCGAAAAIGAAFNAPLAGAFYAFELIVGSYTLTTLAPVAIAALMGVFTARWIFGTAPIFVLGSTVRLGTVDYVAFVGLGLASAGLAILVMKGVTGTEQWFRRRETPLWLRPAIGGAAVGLIAFVYPQVLGSGHGAILYNLHSGFTLSVLTGLVLAKIAASAISIGSGFRGGLFSSSLFLGSLFGTAVATLFGKLLPMLQLDPLAYTLVGMGSVAAAIVGAPVTMILLVLETTSDFAATIGVTVGVIVAVVAVRHWFGYSFATWRFHLRGLKIRSPEDIGWIDELRVARVMRRDAKVIREDSPLATLRRAFPAGSAKQVFAVDSDGSFVGTVDLAEAHAPDGAGEADGATVRDLIHGEPVFLLPGATVRTALQRFVAAAAEALPVVSNPQERRIVGYLTEAYALRRYSQELERRRGQADDAGLFSPGISP